MAAKKNQIIYGNQFKLILLKNNRCIKKVSRKTNTKNKLIFVGLKILQNLVIGSFQVRLLLQ